MAEPARANMMAVRRFKTRNATRGQSDFLPIPRSRESTVVCAEERTKARASPARSAGTKLDRLVHGSRDCGVEGRAPRHARRPAPLLGLGDHDGADAAGGLPPGTAPDRRTSRIDALRLLGLNLAAPDHSTHEPTRRDIAGVATATGQRTGTPAGRQHRAQALRSR
jgi:hypothetical protein